MCCAAMCLLNPFNPRCRIDKNITIHSPSHLPFAATTTKGSFLSVLFCFVLLCVHGSNSGWRFLLASRLDSISVAKSVVKASQQSSSRSRQRSRVSRTLCINKCAGPVEKEATQPPFRNIWTKGNLEIPRLRRLSEAGSGMTLASTLAKFTEGYSLAALVSFMVARWQILQ